MSKQKKAVYTGVGMVCILLAMVLIVDSFGLVKTDAVNVSNVIRNTLDAMGVLDARRTTEREVSSDDAEYICYCSDSMGMVFYFDANTGYLSKINSYVLEYPERGNNIGNLLSCSTEQEIKQSVLEFAQSSIRPYQVGELRIDREWSTGDWKRYEIKEYYGEQETGTTVSVACLENGMIQSCIPHFGKIFRKKADGSISMINGDTLVGEERAVQSAVEEIKAYVSALDSFLNEDSISCELNVDMGIYKYRVYAEVISEDRKVVARYVVWIDAGTGAVLQMEVVG